jgi:hypothetical protein
MAKRTYRKKSSRGKGSRKGSKRTYRKKGSRKGSKKSKRLSRFKADPSNRCSMNKKAQCVTDPNCQYVKKRGCRSRQGTVTGGLVFEGPLGPPAMRIKKRKGSRKGSKKSHRKSRGRKGSKKSSRRTKRKGSKKSKRKSSKRYSKRR